MIDLVEQASQATEECSQSSFTNSIEKIRKVLKARSDFLQEAIIYALLPYEGEQLPVEIIDLDGDAALVRALPEIKNGELKPIFPFKGRKSCTKVMAQSLTQIEIHR